MLRETIKEMGLNELFTFERARANKRPVSGKWSLLAVMFVGAAQHEPVLSRSMWGIGGGHTAARPARPSALQILLKKRKKPKNKSVHSSACVEDSSKVSQRHRFFSFERVPVKREGKRQPSR